MTFVYTLHPTAGLTRWGIFYSLDCGYVYLHLAGRQLGVLWDRS